MPKDEQSEIFRHLHQPYLVAKTVHYCSLITMMVLAVYVLFQPVGLIKLLGGPMGIFSLTVLVKSFLSSRAELPVRIEIRGNRVDVVYPRSLARTFTLPQALLEVTFLTPKNVRFVLSNRADWAIIVTQEFESPAKLELVLSGLGPELYGEARERMVAAARAQWRISNRKRAWTWLMGLLLFLFALWELGCFSRP